MEAIVRLHHPGMFILAELGTENICPNRNKSLSSYGMKSTILQHNAVWTKQFADGRVATGRDIRAQLYLYYEKKTHTLRFT